MAVNYSKQLPQDRNNVPMIEALPPFPALAQNVRDTGAISSVWALNPNTTAVQVAAVGGPVVIKWVGNQAGSVFGSVAGANYDAVISQNSSRLFVVPRSVAGIANWNGQGTPSVQGLNISEGLYPAIATRSLGVASVLLTEY